MQKLAISFEEAAQALGVSRAHLFRLAGQGLFPTKRLGKRRVVPVEALQRMLEAPEPVAAEASK